MPLGVTWSKRMSIYDIGAGRSGSRYGRIETPGGEFKHGTYLFPRQVELLHDLIYAGSSFEILKHGGNGHPSTAKHPSAAKPIRHAFNSGT